MSDKELKAAISGLEKEMFKAAAELRFEDAADLRDEITKIKKYLE